MADRAAATPNEMLSSMQRAASSGAAMLLSQSAVRADRVDEAEQDRRTLIVPAFVTFAQSSRRPVIAVAGAIGGLLWWLRSRPAGVSVSLDDAWSVAAYGLGGMALGAVVDRVIEGSPLDVAMRPIGPLPTSVEMALLRRLPDASPARVAAWRDAWQGLADSHNAGLPRGGGGLHSALALAAPLMRH
jgi:hypothetical protein